MSLNLLLAFCFLINVDLGSASAHGYCYNTYDNPYRWYSTSTRYQTVWDTKTESHLNTSHIEGMCAIIFIVKNPSLAFPLTQNSFAIKEN